MNRVPPSLPTTPVVAKPPGNKILVVDDEPLVRKFIETSLRSGGYEEILVASNGSTVPQIAVSERPDLIIMDVMMPGGNGLRALRTIKQNAHTTGIPVILTSGFNVLTLGDCDQNHAELLLTKPFTAAQLLKEVSRILNARHETALERPAPFTLPAASQPAAMA